MKALILLTAFSLSSIAHASYFATHCSTADGTLRWETGHNSNTIRFENFDNVEIFSFGSIKMKEKRKVMISEIDSSTCQMHSLTKKYIQEVVISAEDQDPEAAAFIKENFGGTLNAELFCVYHINGRSGGCPQ